MIRASMLDLRLNLNYFSGFNVKFMSKRSIDIYLYIYIYIYIYVRISCSMHKHLDKFVMRIYTFHCFGSRGITTIVRRRRDANNSSYHSNVPSYRLCEEP